MEIKYQGQIDELSKQLLDCGNDKANEIDAVREQFRDKMKELDDLKKEQCKTALEKLSKQLDEAYTTKMDTVVQQKTDELEAEHLEEITKMQENHSAQVDTLK